MSREAWVLVALVVGLILLGIGFASGVVVAGLAVTKADWERDREARAKESLARRPKVVTTFKEVRDSGRASVLIEAEVVCSDCDEDEIARARKAARL